jgi:hypothetical protein
MLDTILSVSGIWSYFSAAAIVAVAIVAAYLRGGVDRDRKHKVREAQQRLDAITRREDLGHEAQSLDDTSLADRLTRR